MDCNLSGSSVHGIFQARMLEWIAISFSRGSYRPRNRTRVSRIAGGRFTIWATQRMALSNRTRPVPPSVTLSHQEASISLLSFSIRGQRDWKPQSQKTYPSPSEGRQTENHNHRKLANLITWTTALSKSTKLWAMPCSTTQDGRDMVESSDKMWSAGEGNGKPLQYSCTEKPMNSMKRQKVMT